MNMDDTSDAAQGAISRRVVVAGLATAAVPAAFSAAALPAKADVITAPATSEDERLMREAIALAAEADFPFGAVIVRDGTVMARGLNLGKRTQDPTAHGEMVAIRRFLTDHGPEALKGTTLYTSGEPCPMCMGAIIWCGIARVVYAASTAELGARIGQIMVSCTEVADKTPFAKIEITGGVLADEAIELFR
jgi:tRNA(Arg) A34 adenosine deaminase TadA